MSDYIVKTNRTSKYAKVKTKSQKHALELNGYKIVGIKYLTLAGRQTKFRGIVKSITNKHVIFLDFDKGYRNLIHERINGINGEGLSMYYGAIDG